MIPGLGQGTARRNGHNRRQHVSGCESVAEQVLIDDAFPNQDWEPVLQHLYRLCRARSDSEIGRHHDDHTQSLRRSPRELSPQNPLLHPPPASLHDLLRESWYWRAHVSRQRRYGGRHAYDYGHLASDIAGGL